MEVNEFLEWIKQAGKMEALQNFADKICEKQKETIANEFDNKKMQCLIIDIKNFEQPKIEDL